MGKQTVKTIFSDIGELSIRGTLNLTFNRTRSKKLKMSNCMSSLVKYLLFTTNFLIFALGLAVFGCGIWVLVDQPSFMNLFTQATANLDGLSDNFDITLYTSAAYILLVVSVLVIIIAFFGCCGAWKESKCMLGTYFVLILAMFIVMVVGAVLGYSGDLESIVKSPLEEALAKYNDNPQNEGMVAYKAAWNEVQAELRCCGVENAADWKLADHDFPGSFNKPEGCCKWNMGGTEITDVNEVKACRESSESSEATDPRYHFQGCYTLIENTITDNQDIVVGVAIATVVVMFLNMLFAFAMCTMVDGDK